jgi:RNA polymerase sigma factor (sigma-70 family)
MQANDWLAQQFEENRGHLRALAYRMMGSLPEAEDAVQEAWLRLSRSDAQEIDNLGGWLTMVVSRVCLDMLRSRKSRREEPLDAPTPSGTASPEPAAKPAHRSDPEQEALLADSVGLALLVVLERLNPAERLAFVLHDMFDLDFEEIGGIVGRSATAARQLASRARKRVRGTESAQGTGRSAELSEHRRIVDSFLTALRAGDFNALVALLDPEVEVHVDPAILPAGVSSEIRGAEAWARRAISAAKGAKFARTALIDGAVGAIVAPRGRLFRAFQFTIVHGKIARVELVSDPARLRALDLAVLEE